MGRGVSSGGGQSSLGYLFGSGEAPKPAASNAAKPAASNAAKPAASNAAKPTTINAEAPQNQGPVASNGPSPKSAAPVTPEDVTKQIPAGIHGNPANNYFRADGQNSGNFITDRPSTKVHAAPGGGSSLGYLFGGGSN